MVDFSDPQRQVAAVLGIETNEEYANSGFNNIYRYGEQSPLFYTDPNGEFAFLIPVLWGVGVGVVLDITVQLATNGGNFSCINWKNVAIAGAVGVVSPTVFATVRTASYSAGAVRNLQNQLFRAKAPRKRAKLRSRIHSHNRNFTNAVATQAAWQVATYTAQQNSGSSSQSCGCP